MRERGQGTVEYVGALTLVACVLAAAATAVAAPDLAGTVVGKLRLGLCLVGADICSAAQASAEGLEPCVVSSNGGGRERGVTLGVVRLGRGGSDLVERLSDGTFRITRSKRYELAGTLGAGVSAGPLFEVGVDGTIGAGFAPGEVWTVDARTFRRAIAGGGTRDEIFDRLPAPTARFHELSNEAGAAVTVEATSGEDVGIDAIDGGVGRATELGMRTDADGTRTFYYSLHATQLSGVFAGLGPEETDTIVEWRATEPPQLTLRVARPAGDEASEEFVGRVTLSDPADRSAAARAVVLGGVLRESALEDVAAMIGRRGSVERLRYEEVREASGTDVGVRLGVGLGYDTERDWTVRQLVEAELLRPDAAVREDCLAAA